MRLVSTLTLFLTASVALAQGNTCFSGPAAGAFLGNLQDTVYPGQAIGFAFPLGGTTYTTVHVSDHGFVALSNGGVPTPPASGAFTYTPSLANFGSGGPIIAAMWSDTIGGSATPGAGCYVDSSPTQCRIEWRSVTSFGFPTPEFNLAVTLFPSGQVQFDYGVNVTNNSTFGGVSDNGIVGVFAGGALPASVNLSAGGASASDNTFENFVVANTFDMAVNRLLMLPSNPGWSYVLLGSSGNCGSSTNFGEGCGAVIASFYERFATTPSIDLSNSSLQMFNSGTGYVVLPGSAAFVPPSATATNLGLGDDSETTITLSSAFPYPGGSTTSLNVASNGHVSTATNNAAFDFTPTPAEFLAWTNPTWAVWRDFICNASGNVKFEEVGGTAYITWDGVIGYVGTTPGTVTSTFQLQFQLATGNVAFVFQSMDTVSISTYVGGDGYLVGYSGPGASLDGGASDLSALASISLPATDTGALALTNNGQPVIGSAAFGYTINEVPGLIPFAFLFFGTGAFNPGIDLTPIGMPGCASYTTADLTSLTAAATGGTATVPFPIPLNNALAGLALTSQAVAFSLVTPLNLISSNGNTANLGF
jgi:hypothetical protein